MQESCNSSRPLCICSKNMTTDQLLRHMRQNLQLDHFELAYYSLEPEKGRAAVHDWYLPPMRTAPFAMEWNFRSMKRRNACWPLSTTGASICGW